MFIERVFSRGLNHSIASSEKPRINPLCLISVYKVAENSNLPLLRGDLIETQHYLDCIVIGIILILGLSNYCLETPTF